MFIQLLGFGDNLLLWRSLAFILFVVFSLFMAVVCYFEFDWTMRNRLVDFKKFPIKAQRIVGASIHLVFIIPEVIVGIMLPQTGVKVLVYLLMVECGIDIIYGIILRDIFCRRAVKANEIKEKIIALHLADSTDYAHVKAELKSWYDISATAKQIEKAQQQIREDLSKKEKE